VFLTGYIAGVHFVQTLSKLVAGEVLPRIVTVGRSSEGETEVMDHDDLESAFDHVVVCLFPYAVVLMVEGDLYRWYVCRPDVPDDMVAAIDMRAVVSRTQVTTSTPMIDGEDFDGEVFFDGFAAGLDAEDHPFQISFGTLDVMASLLLEQAVVQEELR
jgi:hypothetical protein